MCGIAGFGNFCGGTENERKTAAAMLKTLKHRGPDGEGVYIGANICLIHTRLAVVDIENGSQPMVFSPGAHEKVIIYNGELYNTGEIREELLSLGYVFKGHSDTEVLLAALIQWGRAALPKLNGIFAFAFWDEEKNELFIARDRMGVKPLFYCLRGGHFIFASEIKALFCHDAAEAAADEHSFAEILLLGPGRTPGCGVFKGVEELAPGHFAVWNRNGLKCEAYWCLKAFPHKDSLPETVEKTLFLLQDAIKRQTVADVPLGAFLSGGLDSSIIAALSGVKKTFSVNYLDNAKHFKAGIFQPDQDENFIRLMSEYLGVEHQEIILNTAELTESLFKAVEARDLPGMADVDGSLLLFAARVKNGVTVALSGECADEIFGGYPWYTDESLRRQKGFPWSRSISYRASFAKRGIFTQSPDEYVYSRYQKSIENAPKLHGDSATEKRMKEMFILNAQWFMQTLLDRKDRMTMACGLEVRVPFCDHRIVEYLYNVPWKYKNHSGREKGLLRLAVKNMLPRRITERKKSPYPKTHNPLYLKTVADILKDIISDASSPLLQIVRKERLAELLREKTETPWYGQLMTTPQTIAYFIQINHWLKHYRVKIQM